MITFLDGPAAGETLHLRRAPLLLRVVHSRSGWDALDQFDDEPRAGETIHVYTLAGAAEYYHVLARGRGGKALRGFWARAKYVHVPDAAGPHVRNTTEWREWCQANAARFGGAAAGVTL